MSKSQNAAVKSSANNLASSSNAQMLPYISSLQGAQANTAATNQQPAFSGAMNAFSNDINTGGYNMGNFNNTLGGYNTMASTGGFTPTQSNAYMDQATSGVTNTYQTLMNQVNQAKSATGGLGGGGEVSQMARQLSQAQAGAEQGAAVNLNQQINANKLSGLGGAAGMQASQAGNSVAAAGGLGNLYNTATGQITAQGQQILSAMGINFNNQQEALQALTSLATSSASSQGLLGNIGQVAGDVAGVGNALTAL